MLKQSDMVIACVSKPSSSKQGYVNQELRLALVEYARRPPGSIYLIPLKLEPCEVPDMQLAAYGVSLRDFQWLDYWESDGFELLVRAIEQSQGNALRPSSDRENGGSGQIESSNNLSNPMPDHPKKRQGIMSQQRLSDLQSNLDLLYEKLGTFERELILNADINQRFAIRQRIKDEILPSIRQFEAEYWELKPKETIVISEPEAEETLSNIKQVVTTIEEADAMAYPPEMQQLLVDIRSKLNDLDKAAAAKLKIVLPIIPMLASYELEMDTEALLSRLWRSLRNRLAR